MLLLLLACNPPTRSVSELELAAKMQKTRTMRVSGEVLEVFSYGEVLLFNDQGSPETASFTLADGTAAMTITYLVEQADGPIEVGDRLGADVRLQKPVVLGTASFDDPSMPVALKVWHLEEAP